MGVGWDGYFGLELDGGTTIMFIINMTVTSIALLIQCTIGSVTLLQTFKKKDHNRMLTACFMFSFCSVCINTVCFMVISSFWYFSGSELNIPLPSLSAYYASFGSFLVSILGTFILRLHMTFKSRTYRMSLLLKIIFIIILSGSLVGFVVLSVTVFLLPWEIWRDLIYYILFPSIFLYVLGIVLALYFFVSRLTKLAKAQEITLRNSDITPNDIKLDEQQQELSDLAAKYTMLFSITLLSTILMQILGLIVNLHSGFRWALIAVDFAVNLQCIYLQFSWAKADYVKWCGCCDRKFRGIITKRTQKRIYKHCIQMRKKRGDSVDSDSWNGDTSQAVEP